MRPKSSITTFFNNFSEVRPPLSFPTCFLPQTASTLKILVNDCPGVVTKIFSKSELSRLHWKMIDSKVDFIHSSFTLVGRVIFVLKKSTGIIFFFIYLSCIQKFNFGYDFFFFLNFFVLKQTFLFIRVLEKFKAFEKLCLTE